MTYFIFHKYLDPRSPRDDKLQYFRFANNEAGGEVEKANWGVWGIPRAEAEMWSENRREVYQRLLFSHFASLSLRLNEESQITENYMARKNRLERCGMAARLEW